MPVRTHVHTHTTRKCRTQHKHTHTETVFVTFCGGQDTIKSKSQGTFIAGYYYYSVVSGLHYDWLVTFSPPTRNKSTAARLMPSFSHKPESISLMETPGLMGTEQHEPSGRLMLQWRTARSGTTMEFRDVSPWKTENYKRMNNANKLNNHKNILIELLNWRYIS